MSRPNLSFFKKFISGEAHLAFWDVVSKGVGLVNTFFIITALSVYLAAETAQRNMGAARDQNQDDPCYTLPVDENRKIIHTDLDDHHRKRVGHEHDRIL